MASTKLTKSQSGTSTNDKKGTFSWWMKRSNVSSTQYIISMESGQERFLWYILSSGAFSGNYRASGGSPDSDLALTGTPLFRDPSAWYHCVLAWDTTQGTQLNRIRFYVNNTEYVVTQSQTIAQDTVFPINKSSFGSALELFAQGSSNYFDGIASHVHYIDGQQLTPSTFGETDSTTGEWKIKTSPTVTMGTQGYTILKDGMTITDQSTNSNNFTLASGTLTKTEDCPSNVFCTINPLHNKDGGTFANGNTKYTGLGSSPYDVASGGTLGFNSGKWYWEWKWGLTGSGNQAAFVGIIDSEIPMVAGGNPSKGVTYRPDSGDVRKDASVVSSGNTGSANDIFGMAFDMDNGTLKLHKNGTYFNSGNAVVTGIDLTKTYVPYIAPNGGTTVSDIYMNFGNGYFGTTAVASAGTNASNLGIFEYDVPAGYTALCTKGLNE